MSLPTTTASSRPDAAPTGLLRSGAGVTTTRAVVHGEPVVVRSLDLRHADAVRWSAVERELPVAEKLDSSRLVATRLLRKESGGVVLVRPFVHGLTVTAWAATERPRRDEILGVVGELFTALAHLHRRGMAHGGLKPANAIVTPTGRLVLVDALVSRAQIGGVGVGVGVGVADDVGDTDTRYLSPEQAGVVHRTVGPAADLYAAAMTVVEAVAARRGAELDLPGGPGSSPWTVAMLRALGVAPRWRPLLLRLLAPLPEDRYETADDVVAALGLISDGDHGPVAPSRAPCPDRAVDGLADTPIIGRVDERDRLLGVLRAVRAGGSASVCLSGHPGLGKSRLLDELARSAEDAGVLVLRGSAFDEAARRPLGAFREMFAQINRHLSHVPGQAARLSTALGGSVSALLALAPELGPVLGAPLPGAGPDIDTDADIGRRGASPSERGGPAAVAAVAALIRDLCAHGQPGLLLVDDCQWADELSWRLLSTLGRSRGSSAESTQLGIVVSIRPDALPELRSRGTRVLEEIRLGPLSTRDTVTLLEAAAGRLPEPVLGYVVDQTAGNPLYALSTLRALIDTAVLRGAPGRWEVDAARMLELPAPGPVGEGDEIDGDPPSAFLAARLRQLPSAAQAAMRQAAVLGRRFSMRLLASALDTGFAPAAAAVAEATARGIVRPVPGDPVDRWEFSHDRVREAVLASVEGDDQLGLHAAAARALADEQAGDRAGSTTPGANDPPRSRDYDLAYHLERSRQYARATPHALRAAEDALRHNALDVAEANFRIASVGIEHAGVGADDGARFRLHEGMGTVHMLEGRYDQAAPELESAYRTAPDRRASERARVAIALGELAFKRGDVTTAHSWLGDARERLRRPPVDRYAAMRAAVELIRLGLTFILVRCRPSLRRRTPHVARELAARVDTRSGYLSWFTRGPAVNVAFVARALRTALTSGSARELSHACAAGAAMLAGLAPSFLCRSALRLADRSLTLRTRIGDGWGEAHSQHFRGFVLHAAGRYPEAVVAFDAAITRFEVLGDRWEQAAASWQKAMCLYRQGSLHEAGALARDTYAVGARIGDWISAGTALAIWTRCLPYDVGAATLTRELARPGLDPHTRTLLRAALGWKSLTDGDLDGAVEHLTAAEHGRRRSGLRNHFLAPVTGWLAQAVRLRDERVRPWSRRRERRGRGELRRCLRRALWSAALHRGERPAALREWSVAHYRSGRRRSARVLLAASDRAARRLGAEGERAATTLIAEQSGNVGESVSPVGDQCSRLRITVDGGVVQARSLPVMRSVADKARHRAVLEAARRIVTADGPGSILDELRAAVLATTPALDVGITRRTVLPPEGGLDAPPALTDADPPHTELVVKPVAADRPGGFAVRAELPLGESAGHEHSIDVLATLAGAVLERQSLREESAQRITAVQEAERGRIARDLHDELGHLFAGVLEGVTGLGRVPPDDERIERVRELARLGMRTVRSVAWTLRPEGLDDLGVVACVEQLVDDSRQRADVVIDLTAQVDRALPAAVETAVFRVVQEALTNIGRHSGATEVSVLLVTGGRRLRVVVEDDGSGFDPDALRPGSLGLAGMRERAALVGGRLEVQSRPDAGTLVMMEVPLDDERQDGPGHDGSGRPERRGRL